LACCAASTRSFFSRAALYPRRLRQLAHSLTTDSASFSRWRTSQHLVTTIFGELDVAHSFLSDGEPAPRGMLSRLRVRRRGPRFILYGVIFVVGTLIWFFFTTSSEYGDGSPARSKLRPSYPPPAKVTAECQSEWAGLRKRATTLGLTDSVIYSQRCIKPQWNPKADRQAVPALKGPFIKNGRIVNLTSCDPLPARPCDTISLEVSPPTHHRKGYANLLFGMSTTYERLETALPNLAHWLSGSGVYLIAIVADGRPKGSPDNDLYRLEALFASHSILLKAIPPHDGTLTIAQNHFTILADLVAAATPQTQWLALVDDDTFFPSLANLAAKLAKHDASRPRWLGALSEDFDAVRRWGYMAYGGAGVFLSLPLARQLVPRIDDCLGEASLGTGDVILRDCVHAHTATKLTLVPGLYQHDIYGDVSGFYESGVQPLSVHHFRSWYRLPVGKMAAVQKACGDCFLQRWRFGGDELFANGFSITRYASGLLGTLDLNRMEGTWSQPGRSYDHSLGPLRRKLGETEKTSYILMDAEWEDGVLRQVYVKKAEWGTEEIDEVVDVVWEAGKRRWT
jgi:hypothetical protein